VPRYPAQRTPEICFAAVDILGLVHHVLNLAPALLIERRCIDQTPLVPLRERPLAFVDEFFQLFFRRTRRFVVPDGFHDERVDVDVVEHPRTSAVFP